MCFAHFYDVQTSCFLFLFLLTPRCGPLSLVEMKEHGMLLSPTCFSPDGFLEVRSMFFKSQVSESKYIRHSCFSSSNNSHRLTLAITCPLGDFPSFHWLSLSERRVNALLEVFEMFIANITHTNSVMLCLQHHKTKPGLLNVEHSWLGALHFLKRIACSARL